MPLPRRDLLVGSAALRPITHPASAGTTSVPLQPAEYLLMIHRTSAGMTGMPPRAGVTSTSLRFAERGITRHVSRACKIVQDRRRPGDPFSPLSSSPAKPAPVVCQNEDLVGEIPGSTTLADNNEQISCRRIDVHNKHNFPREGTRLSGPPV
jgi:hypothetical protein